MNQIVTELRARANALHSGPEPSPTAQLCAQAADRIEALERRVAQRDRLQRTSSQQWVAAAEKALAQIPGASNSSHPAHSLWLRVEMAKVEPIAAILSADR